MSLRYVQNTVLACLAALLLTACGSGSRSELFDPPPDPDPAATQEIQVTPSLGRINRGIARAFGANGNQIADDVIIGDEGTATLNIPADHIGPVIVEVEGADDADYFDEEANTTLPFPAGQRIRAALPAPRDAVGVSILTELALRLIEASGEAIDVEQVELANQRILDALAEDVEDLLTPPVIVGSDTVAGDLDDDDAGRLAVRLGALAQLAPGDASPALTVLTQLAADAADGNIDGLAGEDAIEGLVYSPATFAADFAAAIRDFADAFGTEALKTRAASAAPKTALGGTASTGTTQPGTVNAAFTGDYLLTYFEAREGGPYTEGETVAVLIDAEAGTLQLGGTLVLSDPFQRFLGGDLITTEINWQDPDTGFEYALSFNDTGEFNEINVGDANQLQENGLPLFLGQLFDDSVEGGEGNPELGCGAPGTASSRPSGAALVGTCAGTYEIARVLAGEHSRMSVTIAENGDIDFDDGVSYAAASLNLVSDRTSCCNRVQADYNTPEGTTITVNIYHDDEGNVRDINAGGVHVSTRAELAASSSDGSGLPEGNVIAGNLSGGTAGALELVMTNLFMLDPNGFVLQGLDESDNVIWTLNGLPKETGTFQCTPGSGTSFFIRYLQNDNFDAFGQAGGTAPDSIGRCTVTIDSIEVTAGVPGSVTAVSGTFSAELLGNPGSGPLRGLVTDGFFRYTEAL